MQPPFSVLVGGREPAVSQSLRVLLEHLLKDRFQLHFGERDSWQELAAQADAHGFDLLMVNLTATPDHNRSGGTLGEITAANVREFKSRYRKPVIILTTWDEPGMFPGLEAAGADAVIRMPFYVADITPHIEKCLPSSSHPVRAG